MSSESVLTGQRHRVKVKRKIVDATYAATAVPYAPSQVLRGARRALRAAERLSRQVAQPQADYVVVGSGKTGIDACLWLLEQGVGPERIRWIMPRDAWLLDRAKISRGMNSSSTALAVSRATLPWSRPEV
jgi:hypothetical protein